jgi:tryptophan 4-dimethylallyltransferase
MGDSQVLNASHQPVYKILSSVLEFQSNDHKLWWHSTAPMFSEMLQRANYDLHSQYKHLGIYKKYIIPFLGAYPTNGRERWLSILTRYGTPFELSLNCSDNLVRYTYEPINAATATAQDPFNTHAIWESLQKLIAIQPGVDVQWFCHFKHDLTLSASETKHVLENGLAGSQIMTQNKLALDLKGDEFMVKTYIYPALKAAVTGRSIQDLMFDSIHRLSERYPSIQAPLLALNEYVESRGADSTASPRLLSCDLIDPSKSRIKIYLLERMVSLPAMEDLWTLGGRRTDSSILAGLQMLRELWELLRIPPGLRSYPEPYLPLGTIPNELLPSMANYTLHHDDALPEPQVYFNVFGMNDMEVADALTTFFERQGLADMASQYKDSLRAF